MPTMRYEITFTHSWKGSRSQSERIMNIEPTFDPFLAESPICSSTWSRATACSFLRWWWILMGAKLHQHIFSWFVKMIGALTSSHHYGSLKLLFVPPWKKRLGLYQLVAKHFGPWLLRSWKCCMFVLSFGNFSEVSRSQINKRLLWSGLQSDWGRWDAPCPLWNPALPSCQPQLDVWLAARSEWIFFFSWERSK